jgi:nuclear pore complex protein Nup133
MATFSPSPTPRRSTRLRPQANSPPRRIRVGNSSGSASRLATPVRGAGYLSVDDNASIASGMDVDGGNSVISDRSGSRQAGEIVFAKSDELSVSFYTDLPVEVKQVLKNAGVFVSFV